MREIKLWTGDGYLSTPDGNSIYFWGLRSEQSALAQVPGPHLVLHQGEPVQITLTNTLSEPVSLQFPGQTDVQVDGQPVQPQYTDGKLTSLTNHALPGETISYSFTPSSPGTFMYESGSNPNVQVALGLYGGIVVRPIDFNPSDRPLRTAYGQGTDTEFDREYMLIVSEIDPVLHNAVDRGKRCDVSRRKPRYWTLNGRCAPDTMWRDNVGFLPHQPYGSMVMGKPDEIILMRYASAGVEAHPLHPHGNHTRVVALDGRLLRNDGFDASTRRFTVRVQPGRTYDLLFRWHGLGFSPDNPIPVGIPDIRNLGVGEPGWTMWSGSPYLGEKGDIPVGVTSLNEFGEYYFMLHSHEEYQITNWGEFPGGMMTMIGIYPELSPVVGMLS